MYTQSKTNCYWTFNERKSGAPYLQFPVGSRLGFKNTVQRTREAQSRLLPLADCESPRPVRSSDWQMQYSLMIRTDRGDSGALDENHGHGTPNVHLGVFFCVFYIFPLVYQLEQLTLRWLMSYIYGAPILDVSRSHTTTQHSR